MPNFPVEIKNFIDWELQQQNNQTFKEDNFEVTRLAFLQIHHGPSFRYVTPVRWDRNTVGLLRA